jgi:hypothetical protein
MKKDLVKHYLLKYPDYPKRTLAKLIVQENPDIGTINSVRNLILLSTGSMGETHKNKAIMHTKSTIQEGLEKLKVVSHNKEMENVHLGQRALSWFYPMYTSRITKKMHLPRHWNGA